LLIGYLASGVVGGVAVATAVAMMGHSLVAVLLSYSLSGVLAMVGLALLRTMSDR